MSENMDDLILNVKKMVDSGNLPSDMQEMLNNIQNNSNTNNYKNSNSISNNNDMSNILNQISPEMINNISNIMNSNNSASNTENNNSNGFNLDMNTLMKMRGIMDNMNNKNDPRANLLYSLKPYLRESRKDKLDQYVNMLNITKIADFMNKREDNKNE